jgi:hypothetical protein
MKLNSAQLKQTLAQFEAQPIPEDHPLLPKLNEMFGNHTFFLDVHGLNVVEPMEVPSTALRPELSSTSPTGATHT